MSVITDFSLLLDHGVFSTVLDHLDYLSAYQASLVNKEVYTTRRMHFVSSVHRSLFKPDLYDMINCLSIAPFVHRNLLAEWCDPNYAVTSMYLTGNTKALEGKVSYPPNGAILNMYSEFETEVLKCTVITPAVNTIISNLWRYPFTVSLLLCEGKGKKEFRLSIQTSARYAFFLQTKKGIEVVPPTAVKPEAGKEPLLLSSFREEYIPLAMHYSIGPKRAKEHYPSWYIPM